MTAPENELEPDSAMSPSPVLIIPPVPLTFATIEKSITAGMGVFVTVNVRAAAPKERLPSMIAVPPTRPPEALRLSLMVIVPVPVLIRPPPKMVMAPTVSLNPFKSSRPVPAMTIGTLELMALSAEYLTMSD